MDDTQEFFDVAEEISELSDSDFISLVQAEVQERANAMSCSEARRYSDSIRSTLTKMLN